MSGGAGLRRYDFGDPRVVDLGLIGTLTQVVMAPDDADAAASDDERWLSATGAKAFRVIPLTPASALTSLVAILFGYSTTASDLTAVNAQMAQLDASISAPTTAGGVEVTQTGLILPVKQADGTTGFSGDLGWVKYDGVTTIKTIAVRSTGANFDTGVVLELIV